MHDDDRSERTYYIRVFFFNDTATTEIYTLSLHDALPIFPARLLPRSRLGLSRSRHVGHAQERSEEHTSELQSPCNLGCRLLLEKKKSLSFFISPGGKFWITMSAVLSRSSMIARPVGFLRSSVTRCLLRWSIRKIFFFFTATGPPPLSSLSLHDALPI